MNFIEIISVCQIEWNREGFRTMLFLTWEGKPYPYVMPQTPTNYPD